VIVVRAVAEVGALALTVLATILVSRAVGPEVFGLYAASAVITQLGTVVAGLGLAQSGGILVASERIPPGRALATVLAPRLAAAGALTVLVEVLLLGGIFDPRLAAILRIGAIAWIAGAVRTEWLFVAIGRIGVAAALRLGGAATTALVAGTLIRGPLDLTGLGLLLVGPILVPAALGLAEAIRSRLTTLAAVRTSTPEIRAALSPASHFLRGELATFVTTSSDRLFLLVLTTPSVLGLYEAAYRVIQPFYSVAAVVNDASYARLARAHADPVAEARVLRRYADLSLILTFPLGFFLLVGAGPVIELLYGTAYTAATGYLAILGWVITLGFASGIVAYPLSAWGRAREYGNAVTAGSVTNLVLNLALIPGLQGTGAALATVAAKGVAALVGLRSFRAASRYPVVRDLAEYASASGFALAVTVLARTVLSDTGGGIAGIVLVFGIAYLLAVGTIRWRSRGMATEPASP
jgi:O-antigen/teichoic acid export membrane protein